MDIRYPIKNEKEFKALFEKNKHMFYNGEGNITINVQADNIEFPIIMAKFPDGSLQEWTRGYKNVKSFLTFGYVKLLSNCPYKKFFKACSGEKCQLYLVKNGTGDCSLKWSAILLMNRSN
jgi:hypothetical protein